MTNENSTQIPVDQNQIKEIIINRLAKLQGVADSIDWLLQPDSLKEELGDVISEKQLTAARARTIAALVLIGGTNPPEVAAVQLIQFASLLIQKITENQKGELKE